jgi:hypothetical protein
MKHDTCYNCKDQIDAFNENEYYGINWHVYCGLGCFNEDYSKNKAKRPDSEIKNSSQADKGNKGKNSLQPKRKKSKKRKR